MSVIIRKLRTAMRLYHEQGVFPMAKHAVHIFLRRPSLPLSGDSALKIVGVPVSNGLDSVGVPVANVPDRHNYADWIREYDTISDADRLVMIERVKSFAYHPLISIVMPTYNPKVEWLVEAIESVRKQIYPYWELCIADDASTNPQIRSVLEHYLNQDSRIKVFFREQNGHISNASNSALGIATGAWAALVDHDDLLSATALFWVAEAVNGNPEAHLIYSDEDKIDESGTRSAPYFKCDWNQDLFYSHNLITHLGVYRMDVVREISGFRVGFEGAQDYDLALRFIERIDHKQIIHIPRVLYHWRLHAQSTAQTLDSKPYAMLAGQRALNEHLERRGVDAQAELIGGHSFRVHYALPKNLPLVSLIVPTRNGLKFIKVCIESILQKTTYQNYEIIVVDNGTDDPATLKFLQKASLNPKVRVLRDDRPFNYSALNNAAARVAQGEIIGLINNDIEVITPDWLSEMVSLVLRPEVGAVGARLWYPDNTIQHAGVVLGLDGGIAGHAHRRLPKGNPGYICRATSISAFSAVTGACLLVRKELYDQLGGLDEKGLQIALNDVDFCLRLIEAGYRNIFTPYAELYHYESASRGYDHLTPEKLERNLEEIAYFVNRWNHLLMKDPAYSQNLSLVGSGFSLAWPPRVGVYK